jgi:hypothetical protein
MTKRRRGIGATFVVVAVVIVIIVGAFGLVILSSQSFQRTSTHATTQSSTSSTGPSVSYSTVSASGLRLQVTLNSSSIPSQGEVAAQIEVANTQSQNTSLTVVPNQNISGWNVNDFFCDMNPSHSLVGFALLKGNFAAANVSAGSPLRLVASSVALPCPYSLPLNGTTFLPNSDKTVSFSYYGLTEEPSYSVTAEVNTTTGYCTFSSSLSGGCSTTSGIIGYWNASARYSGNTTLGSTGFTYLPSGAYTIVAMDDWGQTVYAHFRVSSTSTSNGGTVFTITFQQAGTCNPTIYAPKWSVTLGNITKSAQTNNTASNTEYAEPLPPPPIVFSVTNGVYQYSIGPSNDEFQPASGTVTVNGADVVVTVTGPVTSCTAVATA